MPDTTTYWETRWQNGETGWDIRDVSPPLAAFADRVAPDERAGMAVLMPGCGNGHEAAYLLGAGFENITMLDIAPTAIRTLRNRLDLVAPGWQDRLQLVCGDFFKHEGVYDLILEQTFFCALDPSLRESYALKMKSLLKPGGRIAGVLFDREFPGGPPFGGSREEYERLFSPHFHIHTLAPCYNSVPPRAGTEAFFILSSVGVA
ncbi:MAG: methyltransferase domain-containing protein [Lewinellaceae bacterium]|nr:methyltransferase domain-containing protein [Lewinellaceae bacterium]